MAGAKLEPGTVKLRVLMTTRQLQLIFPEKKKSRKKKTKLLRYVIDHALLSRGVLWEMWEMAYCNDRLLCCLVF